MEITAEQQNFINKCSSDNGHILYDILIIMIGRYVSVTVCIFVYIPVGGSCRKFCDNWNCGQFFFQSIVDMFAYRLDFTAEQL